jgi:hypothetical protein
MLQLQIFRQFIEERLDLLNSGRGFSDEFELECVAFTDKSNKRIKNQYAAITQNVRKESEAFVKAVKSKANPAVKDAVKTVKEGRKIAQHKAKATYKDFKSRLRENREEIRNEEMDSGTNGSGGSMRSAPSSPVQSRSSSALGRYGTMTSTQFARQNTDLNFSRVRKYERFDPSASSHTELSPDFEDLPRLEYDLMSDLEEVLSRGKAEVGLPHRNGGQQPAAAASNAGGLVATPPLPGRPPQAANDIGSQSAGSGRKASVVGDLINLDAEEDTELEVVFDPLASEPSGGVPSHRKLSRTGGGPTTTNPFGLAAANMSATLSSAPPGRVSLNNSYGKYENYTPAAGTSQAHFKQFLSSMTVDPHPADSGSAPPRSSDDLLSEYGIHFGGLNLQTGKSANLLSDAQSVAPVYANGSVVGSAAAPPLYSRPNFPAVVAAPPPPPRSGPLPPSAPGRPTNSSFLYSSSQVFAPTDLFALSDATGAMPVNQRIRSAPLDKSQVGDLLADLDPLRSSVANSGPPQNMEVELAGGIRPPAVPPRVRKGQWTTFE